MRSNFINTSEANAPDNKTGAPFLRSKGGGRTSNDNAPNIKTLIHVHTNYSYDSNISVEALADYAQREGIGCVAVTDHDSIEGALELQKIASFKVIIGEEVTTRDGHLIGLFLTRKIEPGMSALETAQAIRDQGGIVLVPHPFVLSFGCGLKKKTYEIADLVDAVEVFNSQNLSSLADLRAVRFAQQRDLPTFVGSDSHCESSIAPALQMMPDFDSPATFLQSLRSAEFTTSHHPLGYFITAASRIVRHYANRALSALTRKKTAYLQP